MHDKSEVSAENMPHDTRRYMPVTVTAARSITPLLRRVTVQDLALAHWPVILPGQWLKMRVPAQIKADASGRAYTIRRFDGALGQIDLDLVVHGAGPCSTWAVLAQAGDVVEVAGPRTGFELQSGVERLIVGGDETALPAIAGILATLPTSLDVSVLIETSSETERQPLSVGSAVEVRWFFRNGLESGESRLLREAVASTPLLPGVTAVWLAGEAKTIQCIRADLADRGLPRAALTASGYWKKGEADHGG